MTFSDHLVLHQLLLSKRQMWVSILSLLLSLAALIIAIIIWFRQLKFSKAQILLSKYQTTTNMAMIIQNNIQRAISKEDDKEEKYQESLLPEAMDILQYVWEDLEAMKL